MTAETNTATTAPTRVRYVVLFWLCLASVIAYTQRNTLGVIEKDMREDLGWTQDQLAAEVGVSRSAVAQWETGRAGQVTTNLTRVAAALGVGVEHLMYGRGKLAPREPNTSDELAILRLYRECTPEDRQLLLRTARRLAKL